MRRFAGSIIFILLYCSVVSGQSLSGIGIKTGVNYARISETGTLPGKTGSVSRFVVGAYSDLKVLPYMYIRYELFYSNKGTSRSISSDEQTGGTNDTEWMFTTTRTLSYLDPSITLLFPLHNTSRTRVHVFTGASLSVNVRTSSTVEGLYDGAPYLNSSGNENSFLPIDPGFIAGAGVEYDIRKVNLSFDVRYVHGLMNIWDRGALNVPDIIGDEAEAYGVPEMHNRTISIMMGVAL